MDRQVTRAGAEKAGRRPRLGWLFALVALGGLIAGVLHFGDLERFGALVRRARPLWLLVALLLQCCTYVAVAVAVALGWAAVLRHASHPVRLRRLVPLALGKLFADQVFPSAGIGGNVLLVDQLTALGASRGAAIATLLVSLLGYYSAYGVLALATLFALWFNGDATPLLTGVVTAFLLVSVAIPTLALWLRARGDRPLPPRLESIPAVRNLVHAFAEAPKSLISDRRLIVRVLLCNGAVFLADAMTLATCLVALGQPLRPATAFVALMMASIVATLGPIPMGLGSFEATCTAMLAMLGVPIEAAIAATLMLRSLTLWLPMVPGLFSIRAGMRRPRT